MFVLLLALLQLAPVDGLECYHCLDVRNVSDCHTVITCPVDSMCFTGARGSGDQMRFNLTCKPKQDCLVLRTTTISPSPGLQTTSPIGTPSAVPAGQKPSANPSMPTGAQTTFPFGNQTPSANPSTPSMAQTIALNGTQTTSLPGPHPTAKPGDLISGPNDAPLTASQNMDCAQCCAKPSCNTYLCSMGTTSITSTGQCHDDPDFNCPQLASFLNICSDVQHAKSVCRDFCGLCDLVDGGWSDWGNWSACGVTCGNGTISRSRTCTNPSPAHGGLDCAGINKEDNTCYRPDCPIAGGWSVWSPWGSCSVSCGVGLERRDRNCSNPYPQRFGDHCFGDDKVYRSCFERSCADGGWSSWSSWGTCSATCNGGLQSRNRTCNNPSPSQFGWECPGNDVDKQSCNTNNCQDKKVAFSVYYSTATLTSDNTPTFTNTLINTGSYNMATGKFTCPVAGIYLFSLTIQHNTGDTGDTYCYFRVNGVTKSIVEAYKDDMDQSSETMIVTLVVGDVMDLECNSWEAERHYSGTMFSGALIAAT